MIPAPLAGLTTFYERRGIPDADGNFSAAGASPASLPAIGGDEMVGVCTGGPFTL